MESKLKKLLKDLKVSNGDHLMIHGNLAALNQNNEKKKINHNLKLFFELLKKKIGKNGVILIPAFTYSFCENKLFDVEKSKSEIGLFSEHARKLIKKRTPHPIFSFMLIGNKNEYSKSSVKTCFGKKSFFDYFKNKNGKIICLGCSFSSITFMHHIEEISKVDYRINKVFFGKVKRDKKLKKVYTNYFVRKDRKIKNNFLKFEKYLKNRKVINYYKLERFNVIKINSRKMFKNGIDILTKKPHFFI